MHQTHKNILKYIPKCILTHIKIYYLKFIIINNLKKEVIMKKTRFNFYLTLFNIAMMLCIVMIMIFFSCNGEPEDPNKPKLQVPIPQYPINQSYNAPLDFSWRDKPNIAEGYKVKIGYYEDNNSYDLLSAKISHNDSYMGGLVFNFLITKITDINDYRNYISYFNQGYKMWWGVQGYVNYNGKEQSGPMSIKMDFSRNSYNSTYNLTVNNSELSSSSAAHNNLTQSSIVEITAPMYLPQNSTNPNKQFSHWEKSGTADMDNINSNITNVRNFGSNVTVTAIYNSIILIPDYTLTVNYNGHTDTYNVNSSSIININAPETIDTADPNKKLHFNHWEIAGSAIIDNAISCSTSVRNFGSNTTVTAVYMDSSVNPQYTLTVNHLLFTEVVTVNPSSVFNLYTDKLIQGTDEIGNVMYEFDHWEMNGYAAIADPNSHQTAVTNIGSDVIISAVYNSYPY